MTSPNVFGEPLRVDHQVVSSGKNAISISTSRNFSFAKVIALFTVTLGHWFTGTILWIPVTFGLFVFAFSSGFFTAALYGERVERRQFWRKKLERLGLRYWVILAFIAVLLLLRDKPLWHWHSLIHVFGLSGILNWAAVPNQSGFGAGLWFFTLLLIFYIAYPYLARIVRAKSSAVVTCVIGFVLAVALEEQVKVGHELWLTALGFVVGVAFGVHLPRPSPRLMMAAVSLLWLTLLMLNLGGVKAFNTLFIAAGAMALAVWLTVTKLPSWPMIDRVAVLDKYLLEIFMIHMYLFVHPTGRSMLDFCLSLMLILAMSVVLGWLADRLAKRVFER